MDISALPGVGPSRAKLLRDMGIEVVSDMVRCFPRDYSDRSQIKTISLLTPDATHTIRGTITSGGENIRKSGSSGRTLFITKFLIADDTGEIEIVWFGQPYLKQTFKTGETYIFTGRVHYGGRGGRLQMDSPEYEKEAQPGDLSENLSAGRIVPLYSLPAGISQKMFRKWMKTALSFVTEEEETLPEIARGGLCSRTEAIQNIHFPKSDGHFYAARRRLVFEELFFMQMSLLRLKGVAQPGIKIENIDMQPFLDTLPFTLTNDQKSVLDDISKDMQSGKRMNRLVQGDVGSGKTVVAAAAAYLVMKTGYQAAIMAPTEVLAKQHFKQFSRFFSEDVVLLTGSLTAKEKKDTYAAIKNGEAKMVVGTHALIQEGVVFQNLALVITDEQHRFGVNQRAALSGKGFSHSPHTAVMTATPIPRTLGLILYGDMDISTINTLPPGRLEIKTYCVKSGYRSRLIAFMAKQVKEKRQVYVICPAIDENSEMDIRAVTEYADKLQKALPDIPVAFLHGRLKDKDTIMEAFARNEYPIIVSTTVIEVGVDVPNATLIVIENAERFGLSQLHQLRGRVGRGPYQSYCVLVTDSKAEHTLERMRAMESTSDGFVLSELDLKMRGPGDFFGMQQHGLPVFALANLYRDMDILKQAQEAAHKAFEMGISSGLDEVITM